MQLAIGLTIGIAGAFGVGRLLTSVLVQTGSRDPVTLTSIVALLIGVSIGAPASGRRGGRRGSIRSARCGTTDSEWRSGRAVGRRLGPSASLPALSVFDSTAGLT